MLDLDDVGAEVGEQRADDRPGEQDGGVDDAQSLERSIRRRGRVGSRSLPSLSGYLSKAVSGWDKRLSTGHERRLTRASDPQRSGRSVRIRAGVPTVMASMASSDTPRSRSRGTTRTKTWP